jgi:hypothetical protein
MEKLRALRSSLSHYLDRELSVDIFHHSEVVALSDRAPPASAQRSSL